LATRSKGKSLPELRKQIDTIDAQILKLLTRRARTAQKIGQAKSVGSKSVLDVGREKAVFAAIRKANGALSSPLANDAVEAIFREIISACRASQEPTSVAFLGPEGTFSHAAVVKQFGHTADFEPVGTIDDVFASVEAGRARYGVVPIENTTEGAVTPTLDALAVTPLGVVAEILVKVDHYLLSKSGDPSKIASIASHHQPLAQCRKYLAEHYPGVEQHATASTATASMLAAKRAGVAAIGSKLAAEIYGLKVVARSIQDVAGNVTRFLVIGADPQPKPSGDDRTSLVSLVRDEGGVLGRVLAPFTGNKVNLSMIESRPLAGRPWEYRFFIDVGGHVSDKRLGRALVEVDDIALSTKVLGSYPVAS
jgi:chorismate mutase/prephenate dehydratase